MATPIGITWPEQASCRDHAEPELWFPIRNDNPAATKAKRICGDCPVRLQCLTEAMDLPDTYGIWGGTDEDERDDLRRRMTRRPALAA